jgi:multidrug transporter EmrE-like cation transporter
MHVVTWSLLLALAALMEVGGDAVIRKGLREHQIAVVLLGFVVVGAYGVVVNVVRWDFARLLGVYVAFFAVTAVVFGRFFFREEMSMSTWIGLFLIVAGGVVIQLGEGM